MQSTRLDTRSISSRCLGTRAVKRVGRHLGKKSFRKKTELDTRLPKSRAGGQGAIFEVTRPFRQEQ